MSERFPEESDLVQLRRNPDWPCTSDALNCNGHPLVCDDHGCEQYRSGKPCPWREGWDRDVCDGAKPTPLIGTVVANSVVVLEGSIGTFDMGDSHE